MIEVEKLRRLTGEVGSTDYSDADLESVLSDQGGDINLAAAAVWEWKAAALAAKFDFSVDGGDYQQSQVYAHCQKQAALYRSRRKAGTVTLIKYPPEEGDGYVHGE